MLDYLLKSGVCLLVFYAFYKLFLEQENMHVYKRIYLIATVVVSFLIPTVTFTTYVELVPQIQPTMVSSSTPLFPIETVEESQNNVLIILWSIYALGVLFFGIRFIKNARTIFYKIRNNHKIKKGKITSVLINEDVVPHTFLNFIFFNKKHFLSGIIPQEVMLHEETHAKQKHTVDVLLIEFLQVVFWFNPLLFFISKSVKLNHEFLADQAVINKGINPQKYQNTLLAYSSNASQFQLANAINYSSIKKRLVIMKTQTSKSKILIRSVLLVPILTILLSSFSTTIQEPKATPKQIKEYNTLAKQYNEQPKSQKIVKLKEVKRLNYLYKLMSPEQKANAEKFPEFPPMPPTPKKIINDKVSYNPKQLSQQFPDFPPGAAYILNNKSVPYKDILKLDKSSIQSVDIVDRDSKGNKFSKQRYFIYTKVIKRLFNDNFILIDGKTTCEGCVIQLTKDELAGVNVSVQKGKIIDFKIKFPGKPTLSIANSNTLNKQSKKFLEELKIGDEVIIFNLKSSESELVSPHFSIKII
jgi:beta-lactamase regulating signal transducer with metallopeptidase domain